MKHLKAICHETNKGDQKPMIVHKYDLLEVRTGTEDQEENRNSKMGTTVENDSLMENLGQGL